jgi:hypothetical protein
MTHNNLLRRALVLSMVVAVAGWVVHLQQLASKASVQSGPPPSKPGDLGYSDTPMLPGLPYRVHDVARPHPPVVTPGATPGAPPSDAIVLFDGKSLEQWSNVNDRGGVVDAKWIVRNGYFEVAPKTGPLFTRENFGDIQLHIEWATPREITGNSQGRGNSGVMLHGIL